MSPSFSDLQHHNILPLSGPKWQSYWNLNKSFQNYESKFTFFSFSVVIRYVATVIFFKKNLTNKVNNSLLSVLIIQLTVILIWFISDILVSLPASEKSL